MLEKIIKYIFIYTICVITIGCDSNPLSNQTCYYCYLELEAPDLPMINGVYQLDYDNYGTQWLDSIRIKINE